MYESAVYRHPDRPYGFLERCGNVENRWDYLIKRKDHQSAEFLIVGVQEEYDIYSRPKRQCGALKCVTNAGAEFTVGYGLSDGQCKLGEPTY